MQVSPSVCKLSLHSRWGKTAETWRRLFNKIPLLNISVFLVSRWSFIFLLQFNNKIFSVERFREHVLCYTISATGYPVTSQPTPRLEHAGKGSFISLQTLWLSDLKSNCHLSINPAVCVCVSDENSENRVWNKAHSYSAGFKKVYFTTVRHLFFVFFKNWQLAL